MINQELSQYVGFTQKEKVLNDAAKILLENKAEKLGFLPKPALVSLVTVSENEEIKSIGGSIPSDLITDQFVRLFGLMFGTSASQRSRIIQDITNVARTVRFSATGNNPWPDGPGGSEVQVGQGSTPPARSDVDIETPFANGGVEDAAVSTAIGVYDFAGQITVTTIITPATGTGTVTESTLVWQFQDEGAVVRKFLMAHDLISPGVSFIATQTITVTYTWQL